MGESFWQNNSLVTHILFELCLLLYLAQSTFFLDTLYNVFTEGCYSMCNQHTAYLPYLESKIDFVIPGNGVIKFRCLQKILLFYVKERSYNLASIKLAVSAKLRQPPGQTQDNFNFGPQIPKKLQTSRTLIQKVSKKS